MNNHLDQNIFWTAEFRMPWIIHRSFSDIRKNLKVKYRPKQAHIQFYPRIGCSMIFKHLAIMKSKMKSMNGLEFEISYQWRFTNPIKTNQKMTPARDPKHIFFKNGPPVNWLNWVIELIDRIDWLNWLIQWLIELIDWIDWLIDWTDWLSWLNWLIDKLTAEHYDSALA